jgi:hypothetical protein
MTPRQKAFAVIVALSLMVLIIELVRRRKLKEEYSVLWLITGAGVVILASSYHLQLWLTRLIGAVSSSTTVFGFAFLFLILISLHFSVKMSEMTEKIKRLSQELAFLKADKETNDRKAS